MKIVVRLFARARDLAGAEAVEVEVAEPATIAALRDALARTQPALAGLLPRCALAVGEEFVADQHCLKAGDVAALLPPVSGG